VGCGFDDCGYGSCDGGCGFGLGSADCDGGCCFENALVDVVASQETGLGLGSDSCFHSVQVW